MITLNTAGQLSPREQCVNHLGEAATGVSRSTVVNRVFKLVMRAALRTSPSMAAELLLAAPLGKAFYGNVMRASAGVYARTTSCDALWGKSLEGPLGLGHVLAGRTKTRWRRRAS